MGKGGSGKKEKELHEALDAEKGRLKGKEKRRVAGGGTSRGFSRRLKDPKRRSPAS